MYGVVWFARSHDISKGNVTSRLKVDSHEDIENSSARKQLDSISENIAPSATNSLRRGIDPPFSRQPKSTHSNSSSLTLSSSVLSLPSYPSKSVKTESGSRFIEKFRESTSLARLGSLEHFITNHYIRQDPFPSSVADIDAPIPLPRLSEWVRADALKGISVHTNPHTD